MLPGRAPALAPRTVSMAPGATQFTRMLCSANSIASACVSPTSPALAVHTWARSFVPRNAETPPSVTMAPPRPPAIMCGAAAFTVRKAPSSGTASTRCHSSSVSCRKGVCLRMAGLQIRKSMRPKLLMQTSASAVASASRVTSPMCTTARPPADWISSATACAAGLSLRPLTTMDAPSSAR
jgi:hypothetical protein